MSRKYHLLKGMTFAAGITMAATPQIAAASEVISSDFDNSGVVKGYVEGSLNDPKFKGVIRDGNNKIISEENINDRPDTNLSVGGENYNLNAQTNTVTVDKNGRTWKGRIPSP